VYAHNVEDIESMNIEETKLSTTVITVTTCQARGDHVAITCTGWTQLDSNNTSIHTYTHPYLCIVGHRSIHATRGDDRCHRYTETQKDAGG
jgi:hypothetical protein